MSDRSYGSGEFGRSGRGSITRLVQGCQHSDEQAQQALVGRILDDVVRLARRKIAGMLRTTIDDEEDVALRVIEQFLRGAAAGWFAKLHDRQDLWQILRVILQRRVHDLLRKHYSQKAGAGRVLRESELDAAGSSSSRRGGLDQIPDRDIAKVLDEAADEAVQERLRQLPDESLRQLVRWRLDGLTNREIADRLGCVERTVERKLKIVRAPWGPETAPHGND
jgi:RNA polymerase sigma factor (sigma-70 family)